MLPVRTSRKWIGIVGLTVAMLSGAGLANAQVAQTSAATRSSSAAVAEESTATSSAAEGNLTHAATTEPTDSEADESPLPVRDQGTRPPPATRWLLIGTGLAFTGAFYAGAYGIGELWSDAPGKPDLRYPVAGPFMDLAHTGCPASDTSCSKLGLAFRTMLISLDALGQIGGVGLVLQGAILGTASGSAPNSHGSARLSRPAPSMTLAPVPWTDGRSAGGLSLTGRF